MSNKWLFFPTQSSGPLQTITFNMSGAQNASSISSSGQEIISVLKVSELRAGGGSAAGKLRIWNGSEAANGANFSGTAGSGANIQYKFTSTTTCRQWWHNYSVSATLNGGSPISLNAVSSGGSGGSEDVVGSLDGACQPGYCNTTTAIKGSDFSSGDVIVLTITAV
tara:strand:+ start:3141 stop:3638 length:498 start_codon:yes stop_codon:yes gene_type:complete